MHSNDTTITIYTNDSNIENKIDATTYNSSMNKVSHQYLGNETQFNVYIIELKTLYLAIKQLRNHGEYLIGRIYSNSQVSVKAIDHSRK